MDAVKKWNEKKKEQKEEFKAMEREDRFKRKLENKKKSPALKEYEFYQREKEKEKLKQLLLNEREERNERMKKLSDPFNKKNMFSEKMDIKDGDLMGENFKCN